MGIEINTLGICKDSENFLFGKEIINIPKIPKWRWRGGGGNQRRSCVVVRFDYFRFFCSKWSQQLSKKSLSFSKTESTSKTESNIIFCMIAHSSKQVLVMHRNHCITWILNVIQSVGYKVPRSSINSITLTAPNNILRSYLSLNIIP